MKEFKDLKIAVAGTGYVGLSLAVLLAQHHQVTALDIVPEKVEMINNKKSPIRDEYIEKYLAEKELDLTATLNAKEAYQEPLLLSRQGHGSEDQLCGREPIRGHTEKMRTDASEIKKKKAEENLHFSTLKR